MRNQHAIHGFVVLLSLLLMGALGVAMVYFAPSFYRLEQLIITPSSNASLLGYEALGQKAGIFAADQQHLKVRYDATQQTWYLANVSPQKKVLATLQNGDELLLKTWQLQLGDVIQIAEHSLTVTAMNPLQLNLNNQQTIRWEHSRLQVSGQSNFAACDTPWWARLLNQRNGFTLGGKVQCGTRLKLDNVPLNSAIISQNQQGHYTLRPLNTAVYLSLKRQAQSEPQTPDSIEHATNTIRSVIIGRTRYQVFQQSGQPVQLILRPVAQMHLFSTLPDYTTASNVKAQWRANASWVGAQLPSASIGLKSGFILLCILTSLFITAKLINPAQYTQTVAWLCPPALSLWLGIWGFNHLGYQLLLVYGSWAWLSFALYWQAHYQWRLAYSWSITLLIAGIGLLTQVQLAIGADSTRWLQYPTRHIQFMLLVPFMLMPLALIPSAYLQTLWRYLSQARSIKILSLCLIGTALATQFILGDEKGIFGFQPVELTKTVLVFMLAGVAVNWFHARQINALSARQQWLKQFAFFAWVLLLALVIYLLVLGGVRDFSPILITGGLLLAFLWLVVKPPHLPTSSLAWVVRSGITGVLLTLLALGMWILADPDRAEWLAWLPQSERITLWADPWRYPDSGRQLQLALEAVHGGIKEAYTPNWLSREWFGLNAEQLLIIPAIQDDFILAFYLHRWGGLAGLVLLLLQIVWIMLLFHSSRQLLHHAEQRNRDQRLAYRFLAYVLFGMAWLHVLHWLISWGNTLGILPIMGQPMTWLSSGMSHLLAVALPSLLLMLLANRLLAMESAHYE